MEPTSSEQDHCSENALTTRPSPAVPAVPAPAPVPAPPGSAPSPLQLPKSDACLMPLLGEFSHTTASTPRHKAPGGGAGTRRVPPPRLVPSGCHFALKRVECSKATLKHFKYEIELLYQVKGEKNVVEVFVGREVADTEKTFRIYKYCQFFMLGSSCLSVRE